MTVAVTLFALLELYKSGEADWRQDVPFGEITVLGIVAITVYALLRRFRPAAESIPVPEQQRAQDSYEESHPDSGNTIKSAMATPALMMAMYQPMCSTTILAPAGRPVAMDNGSNSASAMQPM